MLTPQEISLIDPLIDLALQEDLGEVGDLSTQAILQQPTRTIAATMHTKACGVVSGFEVAERVLSRLGTVKFSPLCEPGTWVEAGTTIVEMKGDYAVLLQSERIMLNFMQRMSGISTATHHFVEAVKGTNCRILDTRKTVPGLRVIDKMAVRDGGGSNHRMGLFDMIMLKDNHIKAAGGIRQAMALARRNLPLSVKIEVETTTLEQVQEALSLGADIIMLDNMSLERMREAVAMVAGRCRLEASGNMSLERVSEVAALGVDYISVGALTHSVKALDISMNFITD